MSWHAAGRIGAGVAVVGIAVCSFVLANGHEVLTPTTALLVGAVNAGLGAGLAFLPKVQGD